MCVKFQLSISSSFRDMRGSKLTLGALRPPARPLAEKYSCLKSVLDPVYTRVKLQLSRSKLVKIWSSDKNNFETRCICKMDSYAAIATATLSRFILPRPLQKQLWIAVSNTVSAKPMWKSKLSKSKENSVVAVPGIPAAVKTTTA